MTAGLTLRERFPVGASVIEHALSADPYPIYRALQADERMSWIPALKMWYVTRYADVEALLKDDVHFVTVSENSIIQNTFGPQILSSEGAEQHRYRRAVQPRFAPRAVREALEATVEDWTQRLIDSFSDAGAVELRAQFAARLPVLTMLSLFGLAPTHEPRLRRWYDSFERALANFGSDPLVAADARTHVRPLHELLQEAIDHTTSTDPSSSLLAHLAHFPPGERLSDEEIKRNASIILFGGISTVEALILNGVYALLSYPDALARARADASLLPRVVEEVIRWLSPVQSATRHVTRDVEFCGVRLRAGDTVNGMLGAANRDPAVFSDPDRFDIDRPNLHRQLGFAAGRHHCLGSHLARLEARTALAALLARLHNLSFDPQHEVRIEGYEFRQPRALHLAWR